ncbi:MAG: GmrSD restriction endonuclease domain-containing protein [Chloroflexia bacterium]
MIRSQDQEIQSLIADIRDGKLMLPELQRSYIWSAQQVRDLFDSIYHQYPSGQILVWETDDLPSSRTASLSGAASGQRHPQLLLDGQQRLTSLAAVMLGQPLRVRGRLRPIDIAFNLFTEKFEVAGPRQRGQADWIYLSKLFTMGAMSVLADLKLDPSSPETTRVYECLGRLDNIKTYKYRVNVLEQLDYNEVTHIFVRINSGGTKLAVADLALAQVSSQWHGVTDEFEEYRAQVNKRGLYLDNGFLMRALVVMITRQSSSALFFRNDRKQVSVEELEKGWKQVKKSLEHAIDFLIHNCLIDRLDMLPTRYVLLPLMMFFEHFGTNVTPSQERELRRWVYMALIWTRYSGATETAIDQDISALLKEQPIQSMIENIELKAGRGRQVTERELQEQRQGSPYMLISYVLARNAKAQDWFNGVVLGGDQDLEVHHIFPKAILQKKYDLRKQSRTVDQVGNLAFLSAGANGRIGSKSPEIYLATVETSRLKQQQVPLDHAVWALERFEDFLFYRRTQLAEAINQLLLSLTDKPGLWAVSEAEALETRVNSIERQLRDLVADQLTEEKGDYAWDLVPMDIRSSVESRLVQYVQRNPFEQDNTASLAAKLAQCQFGDYSKIVLKNWQLFADLFGQKQRFEQHMTAVADARNALKHGRDFHSYERAIAEGGLIWLENCLRSADVAFEDSHEDGAEDQELKDIDNFPLPTDLASSRSAPTSTED